MMYTEEQRHNFRAFMLEKAKEIKDSITLGNPLHAHLVGVSKSGVLKYAKNSASWEHYYGGNNPPLMEYLTRYSHLFQDGKTFNLQMVGVPKGTTLADISLEQDGETEVTEFVDSLPQWPELGMKSRYTKSHEVENEFSAALVACFHEFLHGTPAKISTLQELLKNKEFTPTCQVNLCLGKPLSKCTWMSNKAREEIIQDLKDGKSAEPKEAQPEKVTLASLEARVAKLEAIIESSYTGNYGRGEI